MPRPAARFDADPVRDSWNDAAGTYAQGQASGCDYYRYEFFGPAQLALCGEVRGLSVLDVGCGNGYFARAVAQRGARVTGIDISPRMIEHAKQQESAGPLGIEYHALDAAALPASFTPQSFDMATSCLALPDMPGVEKVLGGVHATLEDWLGWILGAGFQLRALQEPRPTDEALRTRPDLEDAARVPYFLLFDLVRP